MKTLKSRLPVSFGLSLSPKSASACAPPAYASSMAARTKLLSPEQKLEVEAVLGKAVNFLLGSRAQIGLSRADRIAWCATHLLSYLGDCAPPPQPKEDSPQHPPTQDTSR